MKIQVRRIVGSDDLELLTQRINTAQWDAGNDIDDYQVEALRTYLADNDHLFVAAFVGDDPVELGGIASARIERKPYGNFRWLYIDEVDTCVNFRRRGVGKALMTFLLESARERGCQEAWLGTEHANLAANTLYRSLQPAHVESVIGYTYELNSEASADQ